MLILCKSSAYSIHIYSGLQQLSSYPVLFLTPDLEEENISANYHSVIYYKYINSNIKSRETAA